MPKSHRSGGLGSPSEETQERSGKKRRKSKTGLRLTDRKYQSQSKSQSKVVRSVSSILRDSRSKIEGCPSVNTGGSATKVSSNHFVDGQMTVAVSRRVLSDLHASSILQPRHSDVSLSARCLGTF